MTQPLTQQQIAEIKALEGKGEKSYPFHNTVLRLIATLEARDAAFDAMMEALKRQSAAWKNILELNLLPEVHRQSAIFLCDGANAAITKAEKVK